MQFYSSVLLPTMSPEQRILDSATDDCYGSAPLLLNDRHWEPLDIVKTWHNLSALIGLVLRGMIYLLIISVHLLTTLFQKVRKAVLFKVDASKCSLGLCIASRKIVATAFHVYFLPQVATKILIQVLVNRLLKSFSKALELFRKRVDKEHKIAVVKAGEFKKTMTNQQPSI